MKYLYFVVGIIAAVITFIILFAIDTAVSSIWTLSTYSKMEEEIWYHFCFSLEYCSALSYWVLVHTVWYMMDLDMQYRGLLHGSSYTEVLSLVYCLWQKELLVKMEEEIIMDKFILGFMAAWAFTFIFTGIFYKIELSCSDGSTSRKIFNVITTVMANIVWLSPFIFAIAGCLFNFITVIASLIIIVVYLIITAVIGQFLSK